MKPRCKNCQREIDGYAYGMPYAQAPNWYGPKDEGWYWCDLPWTDPDWMGERRKKAEGDLGGMHEVEDILITRAREYVKKHGMPD